MRSMLFVGLFVVSVWLVATGHGKVVKTQARNHTASKRIHFGCGGFGGSRRQHGDLHSLNETQLGKQRISGGFLAEPGAFPSFVSVLAEDKKYNTRQCGGIILTENTVLTSANCLVDNPTSRLSPTHKYSGTWFWDESVKIYRSERHCISPDYLGGYTHAHDFAIIKIDENFELSDTEGNHPRLACLAERSATYSDRMFVAGHGYIDDSYFPKGPRGIAYLPLRKIECDYVDFKQTHFCTAAHDPKKKGDACAGDRGGPIYGYQDDRQVVFGLFSYNKEQTCGWSNYMVNFDIPRYLHLIHELYDHCMSDPESPENDIPVDKVDDSIKKKKKPG